jgi:hypothetical protein
MAAITDRHIGAGVNGQQWRCTNMGSEYRRWRFIGWGTYDKNDND